MESFLGYPHDLRIFYLHRNLHRRVKNVKENFLVATLHLKVMFTHLSVEKVN